MREYPRSQKGNALFLILIAVALFGALSYAVTQSGRGSGSISREKAQLDAAVSQQCMAYVDRGVMMLEIVHGCPTGQISYELPDGGNENPLNPSDTSCFVFHPDGAGLSACGIYKQTSCNLTALAVGEKCPNDDIVYAGTVGGARIYAALTDSGAAVRYSNGDEDSYVVSGATSTSNGLDNTDTLINNPPPVGVYEAATLCRGLGPEWYLPALDEVVLLHSVKDTGAFAGTFVEGDAVDHHWYWTSTETNASQAYWVRFFTGQVRTDGNKVYSELHVRCTRRD